MMRLSSRIALAALVCSLGGMLFVRWNSTGLGVGYLDQIVIVKNDASPKQLLYCTCRLDPDIRKLAEKRADPAMFVSDEADHLVGDQYRIRVMFTSRAGFLYGRTLYHLPQLALFVKLANERWECRVKDLPEEIGSEPVIVDLR